MRDVTKQLKKLFQKFVQLSASEKRKRVLDFWVQVITPLMGILALVYSCSADRTAKRIAHLHVKPIIAPVWWDAGWPISRTNQSYVELVNRGPIDVKSLGVVSMIYVFPAFSKARGSQTNSYRLFSRDPKSGVTVFESELKVGNSVRIPFHVVPPTNFPPIVFAMFASYYRESDMQEFEDSFYFLVDGLKVLGPKTFSKDPRYAEMMKEITKFKSSRIATFPHE